MSRTDRIDPFNVEVLSQEHWIVGAQVKPDREPVSGHPSWR
jgi:hypothetical protein